MNQKTFTIIASAIFGVVALFHVLRIYIGWPAVIGGWTGSHQSAWNGVASLASRRIDVVLSAVGGSLIAAF